MGVFVMKYTLKEKLGYVKKHLEENVPLHQIERKYGLKTETLKYFCWLYKVHGEKAFQKEEGKRREYKRETKLKAIREHLEGKSLRKIGIELMLTDPKIVGDWVEKYKAEGEEGIKDTHSREAYKLHDEKILEKEYKKLLEDLERTKAENEYLKKSFPQALERSKQIKKRQK